MLRTGGRGDAFEDRAFDKKVLPEALTH
jgi:hypothetical protein